MKYSNIFYEGKTNIILREEEEEKPYYYNFEKIVKKMFFL